MRTGERGGYTEEKMTCAAHQKRHQSARRIRAVQHGNRAYNNARQHKQDGAPRAGCHDARTPNHNSAVRINITQRSTGQLRRKPKSAQQRIEQRGPAHRTTPETTPDGPSGATQHNREGTTQHGTMPHQKAQHTTSRQAVRNWTQSDDSAAHGTPSSGPTSRHVIMHRLLQKTSRPVRQSIGPRCTPTH